jgi:geranylgeranylglycerol-phosphate geranylgeranyltransferase
MTLLRGFLRLMRPGNMLICACTAVAGASIGGRPFDRLGEFAGKIVTRGIWNLDTWACRTILAALSASCILAAGNVFNDVRDIACDRINAPDRPLPSGTVSPCAATIIAVILVAAGILVSIPLGVAGMVIALGAAALLLWYDLRLKGVPLAGNLAVSVLGGMVFVYGGIAGGAVLRSLVPAGFAFLLHLARELIKDGADYPGDSVAGIRTVATVSGVRSAARLAALTMAFLAVAVTLPVIAGFFGSAYLSIITVTVLPLVLWSMWSALRNPEPSHLGKLSRILKLAMPFGILAVLAGFQYRS